MRRPEPTTAVVLADTHLAPAQDGSWRRWLPHTAEPFLAAADVILHAGDVVHPAVLERLSETAPVLAVLGNNDRALVTTLPVSVEVELGGVAVAMVHDSGSASGRAGRMARRFPKAAVVIFGHSHIPINESGNGGQLLFNPGSATQRRRQPEHTLGVLRLAHGSIEEARIVRLG